MEAAFERLTVIQQRNINKQMFAFAYDCVVRSKGDDIILVHIVQEETKKLGYNYLEPDVMRYCKLVQKAM